VIAGEVLSLDLDTVVQVHPRHLARGSAAESNARVSVLRFPLGEMSLRDSAMPPTTDMVSPIVPVGRVHTEFHRGRVMGATRGAQNLSFPEGHRVEIIGEDNLEPCERCLEWRHGALINEFTVISQP